MAHLGQFRVHVETIEIGMQLIRERCAPPELYSTCLDTSALICFVSPSLTFLCPTCMEDLPSLYFYLTSTTSSFSSSSPSSLVSPVPGKVIGEGSGWWKWKWPWRKAMGSAVTLHLCVFCSSHVSLWACLLPSAQPLSYYSSPVPCTAATDVILVYGLV